MTPSQVLFRFLIESGAQPLTGCKDPRHVREAVEVASEKCSLGRQVLASIERLLR